MTDIPVNAPDPTSTTPPPPAAPPPHEAPAPAAAPAGAAAAPTSKRSSRIVAFLVLAQLPIMLIGGYLVKSAQISVPSVWAVIAVGMLALVLFLGADLNGKLVGVLINERNLMSLARFQLASWTILICSAFVTIGVARVFQQGVANPLDIQIPVQIWQLLGISATSAVGASLILKTKTDKDPTADAVTKATSDNNDADVDKNRQGIAYANPSPKDARFTDMFEGDEVGNTAYIDLSKLQMFFFTLVVFVAYAVAIYYQMPKVLTATTATFPPLDSSMIALLGISHAAYLGNKSIDHTPTT